LFSPRHLYVLELGLLFDKRRVWSLSVGILTEQTGLLLLLFTKIEYCVLNIRTIHQGRAKREY
jgi:hypothetical protein